MRIHTNKMANGTINSSLVVVVVLPVVDIAIILMKEVYLLLLVHEVPHHPSLDIKIRTLLVQVHN